MRTRWIAAAGLAAIGLVWIGQGLGLIRNSGFMVDDIRWAIAGVVLLATAAVISWTALKGRSQA
jgi:hypothetical protein